MFCSTCGVAVTKGLTYCNYCGARLSGSSGDDDGNSRGVRPGLLVSAISAGFIFGLVAITMLMGMMKVILGLPANQVLLFALVPFLVLLLIEGLFIRLLLRSKHEADWSGDTVQLKGQATKQFDTGPVRGLPEHMPSVTEHTTRTFEPVHQEQTPK